MGTACNCSRSPAHIVDASVPNTQSNNVKVANTEASDCMVQLTTYLHAHQAEMHKKVLELFCNSQVKMPCGLLEINLRSLKFKEKDWDHLCTLMSYSEKLQKLRLAKITITMESLKQLAARLRTLTELKELELVDMNLNEFDIGRLADGLRGLSNNLKLLDLSSNNLKLEQLQLLIPPLVGMNGLQVLILDENRLGDEGAQMIASHMSAMRQLRIVSLNYNDMGPKGLQALLPWMQRRGSHVSLEGNDLSDAHYHMIEKLR